MIPSSPPSPAPVLPALHSLLLFGHKLALTQQIQNRSLLEIADEFGPLVRAPEDRVQLFPKLVLPSVHPSIPSRASSTTLRIIVAFSASSPLLEQLWSRESRGQGVRDLRTLHGELESALLPGSDP